MASKNNKLIAIALLIILLLVLLFVFKEKFKSSQSQMQSNNDMMRDTKTESNDASMLSGSIFDLVKSGGNLTCTFSSDDTQSKYKMSGTSYISGKKMRVESKTAMEGQMPIVSYMISDGEWLYSWSSTMPTGIKMKIVDAEKPTDSMQNNDSANPETKSQMEAFTTNYDFNCRKWPVDNSKFEVPTNIEFMDMSKMSAPSGGEKNGNSMCAACEYGGDAEAISRCKQALSCE